VWLHTQAKGSMVHHRPESLVSSMLPMWWGVGGMNPHTHIPWTTRYGKRWPVHRWNPSVRKGKLEPNRRNVRACTCVRKGEPGAKSGTPSVPVELEASLLLVILHYLLKNNSTFMGLIWCRFSCPSPTGVIRARAGRVLAGGGGNG
jgi:hypothetical protein